MAVSKKEQEASERIGHVLTEAGKNDGERFTASRPLAVTADGSRVVEVSDPAAAFRLVGEGGTIPASLAQELGVPDDAMQGETTEASSTDTDGKNKKGGLTVAKSADAPAPVAETSADAPIPQTAPPA